MSDETIKTTEEAPKQSAVKVGQIPASQPKNRKRNRVGRGHAAGQGKTCGRGIKGQRAHAQRGAASRGRASSGVLSVAALAAGPQHRRVP